MKKSAAESGSGKINYTTEEVRAIVANALNMQGL